MTRLLLLALLLGGSGAAVNDHLKAPPSFDFGAALHAVFVDFQTATYELVFDYNEERARVVTIIDFLQPSKGFPLFDLVPDTIAVATLDDRPVEIDTVGDPDGASRFRVVMAETEAGPHRLVLTSSFVRNVRARDGGISAGLFVNDWDDRSFLELYVPSNLEYDSYRMTFRIRLEGTTRRHEVFANAAAIRVDTAENLWEVRFPDFYTASHVYLHVLPEGELEHRSFEFASAYRPFAVTVYGESVSDRAVDAVVASLRMLEEALGPWPHGNLLVHLGQPGRSMEYAGATWTTMGALRHELAHSYIGRWVAPAGGDASWFDEAAVSWLIDRGAPTAAPTAARQRCYRRNLAVFSCHASIELRAGLRRHGASALPTAAKKRRLDIAAVPAPHGAGAGPRKTHHRRHPGTPRGMLRGLTPVAF